MAGNQHQVGLGSGRLRDRTPQQRQLDAQPGIPVDHVARHADALHCAAHVSDLIGNALGAGVRHPERNHVLVDALRHGDHVLALVHGVDAAVGFADLGVEGLHHLVLVGDEGCQQRIVVEDVVVSEDLVGGKVGEGELAQAAELEIALFQARFGGAGVFDLDLQRGGRARADVGDLRRELGVVHEDHGFPGKNLGRFVGRGPGDVIGDLVGDFDVLQRALAGIGQHRLGEPVLAAGGFRVAVGLVSHRHHRGLPVHLGGKHAGGISEYRPRGQQQEAERHQYHAAEQRQPAQRRGGRAGRPRNGNRGGLPLHRAGRGRRQHRGRRSLPGGSLGWRGHFHGVLPGENIHFKFGAARAQLHAISGSQPDFSLDAAVVDERAVAASQIG